MSKLFEDFNKVSLNEWKEKINQDLKGADYNKNLVSEIEGISVQQFIQMNLNPKDSLLNFQRIGLHFSILIQQTLK